MEIRAKAVVLTDAASCYGLIVGDGQDGAATVQRKEARKLGTVWILLKIVESLV